MKGSFFNLSKRAFSSASTSEIPQKKKNLKLFRKIAFGTVIGSYGYYQWEHYSRNMELAKKLDIPFYKVMMYKAFPFGPMSSLSGWIGNLKIHSETLRKQLFGVFAKIYGCNLNEAAKPLEAYETFGEFFSRQLKPNSRKIEKINGLVSACDGKILHCGELTNVGSDSIYPEQVKGLIYPLNELIGEEAVKTISRKPGKSLFYCTIYLAPGDYHRFHAPTKMKIDSVQQFSGELLSVAPWMMKCVPKLLCMNERVAINGRWKHGFISYVPVGAANVGSIVINSQVKHSSILEVGKEIGHFELGSTVVLIFEAPCGSSWSVSPGDLILLGEPLLKVPSKSWWSIF